MVQQVNDSNSSNPAKLAQKLHVFLDEYNTLLRKADEFGVSKKDSMKLFKMKMFKSVQIDPRFGVIDTLENRGGVNTGTLLDGLEKSLDNFNN
jgi:hypothetical protein